jgi:Putative adhesin
MPGRRAFSDSRAGRKRGLSRGRLSPRYEFTLTIPKAVPGQAGGAKKPGLSQTMLVVIIVVIVVGAIVSVVAVSLFLGPSLSVTTKNFTPYQSSVSQNSNNPSSMTVSNTNGGVTTSTWSQAYVMINGTVTARGFGASTDAITFVESNSSGNIVFQAIFPVTSNFFGASYTVDIHVYEPASYQFNTVQMVTVNGDLQLSSVSATSLTLTDTNGVITASSITATTTTVTDTNGSINLTCALCGSATVTMTNGNVNMNLTTVSLSGSYVVTTTNGNVNLTLPALASFRITPNTTNGTISSSGLSVQLTNHTTATFGTGSAIVNLTTTNGSITVTGK